MLVACNTGPLISAFQSQSVPLLLSLFDEIHVPASVVEELADHGWKDAFSSAQQLVRVELTAAERRRAKLIAAKIAKLSGDDSSATLHHGEADAIVLAQRADPAYQLLLLDELAARSIAQSLDLVITGFPGVLLLGVEQGQLTPDDVRQRLETCRQQGTHYGIKFIQSVHTEAVARWRQL